MQPIYSYRPRDPECEPFARHTSLVPTSESPLKIPQIKVFVPRLTILSGGTLPYELEKLTSFLAFKGDPLQSYSSFGGQLTALREWIQEVRESRKDLFYVFTQYVEFFGNDTLRKMCDEEQQSFFLGDTKHAPYITCRVPYGDDSKLTIDKLERGYFSKVIKNFSRRLSRYFARNGESPWYWAHYCDMSVAAAAALSEIVQRGFPESYLSETRFVSTIHSSRADRLGGTLQGIALKAVKENSTLSSFLNDGFKLVSDLDRCWPFGAIGERLSAANMVNNRSEAEVTANHAFYNWPFTSSLLSDLPCNRKKPLLIAPTVPNEKIFYRRWLTPIDQRNPAVESQIENARLRLKQAINRFSDPSKKVLMVLGRLDPGKRPVEFLSSMEKSGSLEEYNVIYVIQGGSEDALKDDAPDNSPSFDFNGKKGTIISFLREIAKRNPGRVTAMRSPGNEFVALRNLAADHAHGVTFPGIEAEAIIAVNASDREAHGLLPWEVRQQGMLQISGTAGSLQYLDSNSYQLLTSADYQDPSKFKIMLQALEEKLPMMRRSLKESCSKRDELPSMNDMLRFIDVHGKVDKDYVLRLEGAIKFIVSADEDEFKVAAADLFAMWILDEGKELVSSLGRKDSEGVSLTLQTIFSESRYLNQLKELFQ
jgi:hypothetical protein